MIDKNKDYGSGKSLIEIWDEVNWRSTERLLLGPSRDLITEVAHGMWELSAQQTELTLDFWLAAEKYVTSLWMAATRAAGSVADTSAARLNDILRLLPLEGYIYNVRQMAYLLWETRGRTFGRALDDWVEAEKEVLQSIASGKWILEPEPAFYWKEWNCSEWREAGRAYPEDTIPFMAYPL